MRFEPAGMTDDPDIRMAQSVMDYIFRRLALDYLPFETRAELGIYTAEERAAPGSRARTRAALRAEDEVDREALGPVGRRSRRRRRPTKRPAGPDRRGALLDRADREPPGQHRRRAAVHDLRHQDAPGRQLLRLRGLRQHQRLQLISSAFQG